MGSRAPKLEVPTLQGNIWSLADQKPQNYTMIVFYRGLHCPICATYLFSLEQRLANLAALGISTIAISGDSKEHATRFFDNAQLQNLTVGYQLNKEDMQRWGLYMSKGHFPQEPELFSEPALFLVSSNGSLSLANIGSHPFSRIDWDFLLSGIEYVIANNYPNRGTES